MSAVDIVNRALSKLGERRIMRLDEDSKPAAEANNLYAVVRDAELSEHPWGFAIKRELLAPLADGPGFGFRFAYQLPPDCLRVLQVDCWPTPFLGAPITASTQAWVIEGRRLLTNAAPPVPLKYVAKIEDTSFYPPTFCEAFACRLAVELAEALTGSSSKREMAWMEYKEALRRARRINDIQLPPEMPPDDTWLLARL